jgi:sigma-B regulation protein RsbU (phosphoserine phosphatase)
MEEQKGSSIRKAILERRSKLEEAIESSEDDGQLRRLLCEVDSALERMDNGTYGLCEACHEPIETGRLLADPLVHFCIEHLTPTQQRALEGDLELASRIQKGLLPKEGMEVLGWETSYYYAGAGPVSGDYCDLFDLGGSLYFVVGDVSGKGIAASILMSHLHATFRALVSLELQLDTILEKANRMFCESTLPTHFATLACGRVNESGELELCVAGHQPVLIAHGSEVRRIAATGLPLGMFCDEQISVYRTRLQPGECIVLYTDGFVEAVDPSGNEYGIERLVDLVIRNSSEPPKKMISECLNDLASFRSGVPQSDDLAMMVLRRTGIGSN